MNHTLHLVVPCFRESLRLPRFLPALCGTMEATGGVTIQVVDDGSGEPEVQATRRCVEELRRSHACLLPLLELPDNQGKGGAVYSAWDTAPKDADWLAFVDADGSVPAVEVDRLIRELRESKTPPRAIFASRIKMLGRSVDRQLKRHLIGRIYATLVSELLHIPVYDSQCGFKIVDAESWRAISNNLSVRGFAFDVELMTSLLDHGGDIVEIPIDWHETPGGKIHLFRDSWRMFRDVLRIRKCRHTRSE